MYRLREEEHEKEVAAPELHEHTKKKQVVTSDRQKQRPAQRTSQGKRHGGCLIPPHVNHRLPKLLQVSSDSSSEPNGRAGVAHGTSPIRLWAVRKGSQPHGGGYSPSVQHN